MLNKILYKIKTRNYFDPTDSTEVFEGDFIKILRGKVFNPHHSNADYNYMVVGVSENCPLNNWAGRRWGPNGYDHAHECSLWYGKFCCESSSRIIIPGKLDIRFNPNSKLLLGKSYLENFSGQPWIGGGFMQVDKDIFTRTLVSDLTVEQVLDLFTKVYGRDISRR